MADFVRGLILTTKLWRFLLVKSAIEYVRYSLKVASTNLLVVFLLVVFKDERFVAASECVTRWGAAGNDLTPMS